MKILVSVSIPAISQKYDVLIPPSLRIKTIVPLIAETVEELSNHLYISSGQETLCSIEKNIVLRSGATLESYGIENGAHLALI